MDHCRHQVANPRDVGCSSATVFDAIPSNSAAVCWITTARHQSKCRARLTHTGIPTVAAQAAPLVFCIMAPERIVMVRHMVWPCSMQYAGKQG
jgi:hypothetical protein